MNPDEWLRVTKQLVQEAIEAERWDVASALADSIAFVLAAGLHNTEAVYGVPASLRLVQNAMRDVSARNAGEPGS